MKIYFTGSKAKGKNKIEFYQKIVEFLEGKGHEVHTAILAKHLPDFSSVSQEKLKNWFKEWSSYVGLCEALVVEGSYPSTIHIGFEIGMALSRGKAVILIFERGKDPIFINDMHSSRLIKSEYGKDDLFNVLDWALEEVERVSHRRFTFYISPEIDDYLSEIVNSADISRSEYIRMLIEKEIRKKNG